MLTAPVLQRSRHMAKASNVKTAGSKRAKPIRAAITGRARPCAAGYVLTNAELAELVDTSDAWITERTGIKERHILKGKGLGTSHMGAEAVRGLLEKTGTLPKEIDLLICATTTPDFVFPIDRQSDLRHGRHPQHRLVRRAGGVLRLRLRAHDRDAIHRERRRARRSWWSVPTRCRRSSTTPTARPACCSATARARC